MGNRGLGKNRVGRRAIPSNYLRRARGAVDYKTTDNGLRDRSGRQESRKWLGRLLDIGPLTPAKTSLAHFAKSLDKLDWLNQSRLNCPCYHENSPPLAKLGHFTRLVPERSSRNLATIIF